MSSLATPTQEPPATSVPYADRLRRAQAEMARQGIDLLVVGASADLLYLIGYEGHESERMSVLGSASRRCAALRRAGTGSAAPPRPARPARDRPLGGDGGSGGESCRHRRQCRPRHDRGRRRAVERLHPSPAARHAASPLGRGRATPATFADDQGRARDRAAGRGRAPHRRILGGVPYLLDHGVDRVGGSRAPDGAAGGTGPDCRCSATSAADRTGRRRTRPPATA